MLLAVVERLETVGSTTGLAEGARSDLRLRRLLPKSVMLVSQDYLEFIPWRSCLLAGRIDVMQPCSNNVVACDCVCHEDGCQSTKARLLCRRKCGRHGLARWRCLTHRLYGVKSQRLRVAGRQGDACAAVLDCQKKKRPAKTGTQDSKTRTYPVNACAHPSNHLSTRARA